MPAKNTRKQQLMTISRFICSGVILPYGECFFKRAALMLLERCRLAQ
jgi:hypothetical protein